MSAAEELAGGSVKRREISPASDANDMSAAEELAGGSVKRRREVSPASDANDAASAASSASAPGESRPRRRRPRLSGSDKDEGVEVASDKAAKADSDASSSESGDMVFDSRANQQDEVMSEAPLDEASKADKQVDEEAADRQDDEKPADKGAESDDESSSSSSSSSSSTSSSSSSSVPEDAEVAVEQEQLVEQEEEADEEEEDEDYERGEEDWAQEMTEEEIRKIDFAACQRAQLRRTDLLWLLNQLPQQDAEKAIRKAWVRITLSGGNILAQITDLVDDQPYSVNAGSSDVSATVKVSLKCRRCAGPEKTYKLTNISNQEIQEREFEQWIKLTRHHGLDYEVFRPNWKDKAKDFSEARTYKFDEAAVSGMLRRKMNLGIDLEFNAQKESKLRSEAQATLSQMELCGLRENRGPDLEERYANAQSSMEVLYMKSAKLQETWFDKRQNLYSLKEINVKNRDRQTARDKHALNFTYAMEAADEEAERMGRTTQANVFQRRPCRPVSAWDMNKTETDGIESRAPAKSEKQAPPEGGAAAAKGGQAPQAGASAAPGESTRVDRRAHRELLNMMNQIMATGSSSSSGFASSAA